MQTTSPSLGAASVRVQGMLGRYTSFLSDGLPLFGQQGAGLGLLQIPPIDLGQVEVIKGNASALYGSAALFQANTAHHRFIAAYRCTGRVETAARGRAADHSADD